MTRRTAWAAAIVLVTAAVVALGGGCDSPREINEAKPIGNGDTKTAPILSSEKAPEQSDPAAVAVVQAAIAAHTNNKPELLRSLRSVKFTRSGHAVSGVGGQLKQTWTVHASWPDRCRFQIEVEAPQPVSLTLAWGPAGGWQHEKGQDRFPLPPQGVRDFKIDVTGDWLALVFPLAEPNAIYAPAPDQTFNKKQATGVHLWHPDLARAAIHFDKDTKLLAGITYEGRENGTPVTKEITVLSTRDYAGVTLPERTVIRSNQNVLFEWTLTTLEPKPDLESKLFDEL